MYYFKKLSLLIIIIGLGTTTFAQETTHQHKEHLSEILDHYLAAKDALTEDDFETAQSHIANLKEEVLKNDEMNNHEEHSQKHVKHHSSMIEAVKKANLTENISELRSAFKDITVNLTKSLENQGYDQETLYLQYCPMAVNNEGATWISDQQEIINPYMGQQMPSCGKTEKEINADD